MAQVITHNSKKKYRITIQGKSYDKKVVFSYCLEEGIDEIYAPWSENLIIKNLHINVPAKKWKQVLGLKYLKGWRDWVEDLFCDWHYVDKRGYEKMKKWLKEHNISYRETVDSVFISTPKLPTKKEFEVTI